jgi:hypothetical protein
LEETERKNRKREETERQRKETDQQGGKGVHRERHRKRDIKNRHRLKEKNRKWEETER